MRRDTFFWTAASLGALLACGGLAASRSNHVEIAGRLLRDGVLPPSAAKASLRFDDDRQGVHRAFEVACAEGCTFRGALPPGRYRVSVGEPFALAGHRAVVREELDLTESQTDLRLALTPPVTASGTLGSHGDPCPARLPTITFRRGGDGEEFGAAVSCAQGQGPGFAALLEPGVYDVRVELPDGRAAVARGLQLRTDVVDLPLGLLLPEPSTDARVARF
jgi:hypothetical protein